MLLYVVAKLVNQDVEFNVIGSTNVMKVVDKGLPQVFPQVFRHYSPHCCSVAYIQFGTAGSQVST